MSCAPGRIEVIAVVDDDASVRESLSALLEQLGYAVRAFQSAAAFLDSGAAAATDCLLADIAMPGLTGFDLLRELGRRAQAMPTILMTAHADDVSRADVAANGAVACLAKPFGETALIAAIQAAAWHPEAMTCEPRPRRIR